MRQDMTINEVMEYQGRLYYMPRKVIRRKTNELLEFAGLIDYRRRIVRHLSGGMKRKLMICRALMTDPGIILLDEPTAGMDAFARRQMWELLRKLQRQNITIVLTTHYIEEAEALCDRVAFLHKGKLDVVDTPSNLILSLGKYAVDEATDEGQKSHFFSDRRSAIDYLDGLDPDATASLRRTTLEDAFVERIGNRIRR